MSAQILNGRKRKRYTVKDLLIFYGVAMPLCVLWLLLLVIYDCGRRGWIWCRLRRRRWREWAWKITWRRRACRYHRRFPAERALLRAVIQGEQHNVAVLLARGVDPNAGRSAGFAALLHAIHTGRHDAARMLLAAGADVHVRWPGSLFPAIVVAAANSDSEMIGLLLTHGADRDARSPEGVTPLIAAASRGDEEMVRLLLGAGADRARKTVNRWTALHYAQWHRHEHVVALLRPLGEQQTRLLRPADPPVDSAQLVES